MSELLAALRGLDATLYVDGDGILRYAGPKLPTTDPIRVSMSEHSAMLIELFTYAPGGRCVAAGCHRLRTQGSDTCLGPHLVLDGEPQTGGQIQSQPERRVHPEPSSTRSH